MRHHQYLLATMYLCPVIITMKQFTIPIIYRSPLVAAIKHKRRIQDKMKKDFSPAFLDMGNLQIFLARHFGFCYGVENAIEIAFRTIDENPGKRIFLLSEMIHNPQVNADLLERGVQFLQDTRGQQVISFDSLTSDDVVIIPAFGTTLAVEEKLLEKGIPIRSYDTTCPFVEKVWNRAEQIAGKKYTVIVHGKPTHEETRATFSRAAAAGPAIIVNDMREAIELGKFITGEKDRGEFTTLFAGKTSEGFDVHKDLEHIGVVNQTTMLAADTQAIADYFKQVIVKKYSLTEGTIEKHFAETRDTLCYATNDNQSAVFGLLETSADLAIVIGGYNSSNTSHLVALCEERLPTYFINDEDNILSPSEILHYDLHQKEEKITHDFLPVKVPVRILITSGASCPDALVEGVINKLGRFFDKDFDEMQLVKKFLG